MTKEETIRRGAAAGELLASDIFKLVKTTLEEKAFEGWKRTAPDQTKEREEFYFLSLAIAHLVRELEAMESNGKFEKHQLAVEEAAQKRKAAINNQGEL